MTVINYPTQHVDEPDGSSFDVDTSVTISYTVAPPPAPQVVQAPRFWVGESSKSSVVIPSTYQYARFGLIFFGPTKGIDPAVYRAAADANPNVLWCVCAKDDPDGTLQPFLDTLGVDEHVWYAFDQEPNPTDDPNAYINGLVEARDLIDASGKNVANVMKMADYAARHPGGPPKHPWTDYAPDSGVIDVMGLDTYVRPGVGWSTTAYATASDVFTFDLDMAAQLDVPLAITEFARLTLASDPGGSAMAGVFQDDIAFCRANNILGLSYWAGKATALKNPDGSFVDFTPPPPVAAQLSSAMRTQ